MACGAPREVPAPIERGTVQHESTSTPSRTGRVLLLVALALVLVGGVVTGIVLLGDRDAKKVAADTSSTTEADEPPSAEPSPDEEESEPAEATDPETEQPPFTVSATFENQGCSGQFIVMLATSGDAREHADKLGGAVAGVSGAKVLRGADSCEAFRRRDPVTREEIYNAYVGPFPTRSAACAALGRLGSETAWVRVLDNPSKERELCMCEATPDELPTIAGPGDAVELPGRRLVAQVQWALYVSGLNSRERIYGNVTPQFASAVASFQSRQGLEPDGVVDERTWEALQQHYCPAGEFVVAR